MENKLENLRNKFEKIKEDYVKRGLKRFIFLLDQQYEFYMNQGLLSEEEILEAITTSDLSTVKGLLKRIEATLDYLKENGNEGLTRGNLHLYYKFLSETLEYNPNLTPEEYSFIHGTWEDRYNSETFDWTEPIKQYRRILALRYDKEYYKERRGNK